MSIDARIVRSWLLQRPRPAVVRVHSEDGPQDLAVARGRTWQAVVETIQALDPVLIEALDQDGSLLRAMNPKNEAAPTPPAAPPATTDPETVRMLHFATLIHKAYEHSTTIAFDRLIDLVERLDSRTEAMEARLERTERAYYRSMQERIEDAFDQAQEAQEAGSSKDEFLSNFMQGVAASQQQPKQNGKAD